jgi:anti-anti-sigma factor
MAEAVSALGPALAEPDRCIYPRPFAPDFRECPAYRPVAFVAVDDSNNRLGMHRSCAHLVVAANPTEIGGWYARCSLGGPLARTRWVAEFGVDRLELLRSLAEEFAETSEPERVGLYRAKAAAVERPGSRAQAELSAAVEALMDRVRAFLEERAEVLESVRLAPAGLLAVIEEWVRRWAGARSTAAIAPDAELMRALDGPVQAFLAGAGWTGAGSRSPRTLDAESATGAPRGRRVPLERLRIFRGRRDNHLSLVGDIDAVTLPRLNETLADVVAGGATDIEVDMSQVTFCDLGGMRAVVAVSRLLPAEGRICLRGLSEQLRRSFERTGWPELARIEMPQTVVSA